MQVVGEVGSKIKNVSEQQRFFKLLEQRCSRTRLKSKCICHNTFHRHSETERATKNTCTFFCSLLHSTKAKTESLELMNDLRDQFTSPQSNKTIT